MSDCPLSSMHTAAGVEYAPIAGIDVPDSFGDPASEAEALRTGAGVLDLAHVGTASLEGPDARRFANGMFTNNIRDLDVGTGNRSAMCDDRGRVQGLIDVHCTEQDRFDIVLEGVTAAWFEERYGLYIVFDDVELTVSNSDPRVLTVQGPESAGVLSAAGLPVPQPGRFAVTDTGIRVASKDRSGLGGFDLIVPRSALAATWERLQSCGATPAGHAALESARIRAGRPRWPVDGTDKTLIHELRINPEVCNFNKGCYLGQEVINRVDVKGLIQKRLERIVLPKNAGVVGAAVTLDGKPVGIISSVTHGNEDSVALAVLRKAAWEVESVTVETDGGPVTARIEAV